MHKNHLSQITKIIKHIIEGICDLVKINRQHELHLLLGYFTIEGQIYVLIKSTFNQWFNCWWQKCFDLSLKNKFAKCL